MGKKNKIIDNQMSIFDFLEPNDSYNDASKLPEVKKSAITDDEIKEILKSGGNELCGYWRDTRYFIVEKYREIHSPEYRANYIRKIYEKGGKGFEFNDRKISVWYDETGYYFGLGESALDNPELTMTWNDVEEKISKIIESGEYISEESLIEADTYYKQEIAEKIADFYRDGVQEKPEFLPEDKWHTVGWPQIIENIMELLSDPNDARIILKTIKDKVNNISNYEVRWNVKPYELLDHLIGFVSRYDNENTIKTSDVIIRHESFITKEEKEVALGKGSNFSGGKTRIYDYVNTNPSNKELADFLRKEYGCGGSSGKQYDSKGMKMYKGSCIKPWAETLIKWPEAAKIISRLIKEDKYLSDKEKMEINMRDASDSYKPKDSEDIVKYKTDTIDDTDNPEQNDISDIGNLVNPDLLDGSKIPYEKLIEYVGKKVALVIPNAYAKTAKIIKITKVYVNSRCVYKDKNDSIVNEYFHKTNRDINDKYIGRETIVGYTDSKNEKENSWISELWYSGGRYDAYLNGLKEYCVEIA